MWFWAGPVFWESTWKWVEVVCAGGTRHEGCLGKCPERGSRCSTPESIQGNGLNNLYHQKKAQIWSGICLTVGKRAKRMPDPTVETTGTSRSSYLGNTPRYHPQTPPPTYSPRHLLGKPGLAKTKSVSPSYDIKHCTSSRHKALMFS